MLYYVTYVCYSLLATSAAKGLVLSWLPDVLGMVQAPCLYTLAFKRQNLALSGVYLTLTLA